MPVTIQCHQCGQGFKVVPARKETAKFCSYACRGAWRSDNWQGYHHPNWKGGSRVKPCRNCGKEIHQGNENLPNFKARKFCSKECSREGQKYYRGKEHANYRPEARRKNRTGRHAWWARSVISRDNATCQRCGAQDVELHAHHIKPYKDHPELRWDLDNGETLCCRCHWDEHTALNANGVNSGNILPGDAGDNPEPSFGRKPLEGVTTRGRAYRRWNGECDWCGTFISKRWSDAKGKQHLFCSKRCAGLHNANTRTWRPAKSPKIPPTAVIFSTSAPRESDDIV